MDHNSGITANAPFFSGDDVPGYIPRENKNENNKDLNAYEKKEILRDFLRNYEVPFYMNKYSHRLKGREIIFIIDDSGSMGSKLENYSIPEEDANQIMKKTGVAYIRRWDELRYYIILAMKLSLAFDEDGIDVLLLNRVNGYYKNVNNQKKIDDIFDIKPGGSTPLYKRTKQIFDQHVNGTNEIIIIATDGELSYKSKEQYKELIKNRSDEDSKEPRNSKELPIVFMICTDDNSEVEFLNGMDDLPDVGVVDDYASEKKQIKNKIKQKQYSPGAHIYNILLNWVPEIDRIDETPSVTPIASSSPVQSKRIFPKTPKTNTHVRKFRPNRPARSQKADKCCVIS